MTSQCLTGLAALLSLVVGERAALACVCDVSGPPCQATWMADVVFSGTVLSISTTIQTDSPPGTSRRTLVKMSVEQNFVGSPGRTVDVMTSPDSDCGYWFETGVPYLVYGWREAGSMQITTSRCSRTRPMAYAPDDLQYLSTIGSTGRGGRVFGRINEWKRSPSDETGVDNGAVAGVEVILRSPAIVQSVATDADGRFEIAGLPLGKSILTIIPPFGFEPRPFEREIEITDLRACRLVDLTIQQIARVSGIVVDAVGRPLAGVEIDAISANLATFYPYRSQRSATTNSEGVFEFATLPPGEYVFGVDIAKSPGRPSAEGVFVPGTRRASEATVFQLKPGDRKDVGTLRLDR